MKKMSWKLPFPAYDLALFGILQIGKIVLICYVFYDSYFGLLLCIPVFIVDFKRFAEQKRRERQSVLTGQFKSLMEAVASSLQAGYSLEQSFYGAKRDLELLYEKDAPILEELSHILSGMKMNLPLETLLKEFGERSQSEDISNFANVVAAAKRSGGNLVRILQRTVRCIGDKMAVEEEIETMIAAKKLEEKIMVASPYGILFYLRFSSPELIKVLYHNGPGILCMTGFLAVITLAGRWADTIMEINV